MLSEHSIIPLAFIFLLSVLPSCILSLVLEANSWLGNFPRKKCNSLCPYSMNKAAGTVFIQIITDFICPYIMHSYRFKLGEHFVNFCVGDSSSNPICLSDFGSNSHESLYKCPFLHGIMSNNFSDLWVLFLLEHDGFL